MLNCTKIKIYLEHDFGLNGAELAELKDKATTKTHRETSNNETEASPKPEPLSLTNRFEWAKKMILGTSIEIFPSVSSLKRDPAQQSGKTGR